MPSSSPSVPRKRSAKTVGSTLLAGPSPPRGPGALPHPPASALAYAGGAVIAGVGLMSAASILGRATLGRPILGDFELVEIGTAVAGSPFLPYCQATGGGIIVDFFTLRAGERTVRAL